MSGPRCDQDQCLRITGHTIFWAWMNPPKASIRSSQTAPQESRRSAPPSTMFRLPPIRRHLEASNRKPGRQYSQQAPNRLAGGLTAKHPWNHHLRTLTRNYIGPKMSLAAMPSPNSDIRRPPPRTSSKSHPRLQPDASGTARPPSAYNRLQSMYRAYSRGQSPKRLSKPSAFGMRLKAQSVDNSSGVIVLLGVSYTDVERRCRFERVLSISARPSSSPPIRERIRTFWPDVRHDGPWPWLRNALPAAFP